MVNSFRREPLWSVLSVLPLIYGLLFAAALWWWVNVFDPSRVTNVKLFLGAMWTLAAVHLAIMVLMLVLTIRQISRITRDPAIEQSHKWFWVIAVLFFNVLAYPTVQYLLANAANPSTSGEDPTG